VLFKRVKLLFVGLFIVFTLGQPLGAFEANTKMISDIEKYLNSFQTLTSGFVERSPQGQLRQGRLYLSRPGKMRLEYRGTRERIIADGNFLIHHDPDLDETAQVPLDSTPADILLQEQISLTQGISVTDYEEGVDQEGAYVKIELARLDSHFGTMVLVFRVEPTIKLVQWVVIDQQNSRTVVTLTSIKENVSLDPNLFQLKKF